MAAQSKQCRKCNKEKPLEEFQARRASCKVCVNLQRAESIKKKAVRDQAAAAELPEPDSPGLEQIASGLNLPKFNDRDEAEQFIAADLMADVATLNSLAKLYEDLATESSNRKERKEYAAKLETVTQKKIDLKLKLIKSFDFFSDLAKPEAAVPLYTPVHIYLNTEVPKSSIKQPEFTPDPDEIQDLNLGSNVCT